SLVSFVEIVADARRASAPAELRLTPSERGLAAAEHRLTRGGAAYLFFDTDGVFDGSSVTFPVPPGSTRRIYAARLVAPAPSRPLAVDRGAYEAARRSVVEYWTRRLSEGAEIDVPEQRVVDARRNLIVQNL